MTSTTLGSTEKKKFRFIRRSEWHNIMSSDERPKSQIKFEDTLKSKLWRIYGKLFWQPLHKLVLRSINSYSYFTSSHHEKSWIRRLFPELQESEQFRTDWVICERWCITTPPMAHYIFMGFFLNKMKQFYFKRTHLIHNYEYNKKFYWYKPYLYLCYMIEWLYSSSYSCCGYERYLCEDDSEGRYEMIKDGATGTMDGTDYWSYGYIHCERCNTPLWYSESSL